MQDICFISPLLAKCNGETTLVVQSVCTYNPYLNDVISFLYFLFYAQAQQDHVSFSLTKFEVVRKKTFRPQCPHTLVAE